MYEGKEYFVVVEVKNKNQIDKEDNQRNSLIGIVVVIVLICAGFLYHVFFKRKWKNLRNNNSWKIKSIIVLLLVVLFVEIVVVVKNRN